MVRVGSSALFCRKKLRTLVLFEQSLRLLLDQRCLLGIWPRFLAGQKPSRISFVRRSSDCCLHLPVHRQGRKGRAFAVLGRGRRKPPGGAVRVLVLAPDLIRLTSGQIWGFWGTSG